MVSETFASLREIRLLWRVQTLATAKAPEAPEAKLFRFLTNCIPDAGRILSSEASHEFRHSEFCTQVALHTAGDGRIESWSDPPSEVLRRPAVWPQTTGGECSTCPARCFCADHGPDHVDASHFPARHPGLSRPADPEGMAKGLGGGVERMERGGRWDKARRPCADRERSEDGKFVPTRRREDEVTKEGGIKGKGTYAKGNPKRFRKKPN